MCFFFFKQKTAYEWRISDWSSDVCSSDLYGRREDRRARAHSRDRLAARLGLVELGLVGGFDLLLGSRPGPRVRHRRFGIGNRDAGDLRVRGAADGERRRGERDGGKESLQIGHQNCPPTLKVMSFLSSPGWLRDRKSTSLRNGPNGEFQLTPMPTDNRGFQLKP